MTAMSPGTSPWRKSRHSNSQGACIEVRLAGRRVAVRDTAGRLGATVTVTPVAWRVLLAEVRAGRAAR
jgi:hypothetical protein